MKSLQYQISIAQNNLNKKKKIKKNIIKKKKNVIHLIVNRSNEDAWLNFASDKLLIMNVIESMGERERKREREREREKCVISTFSRGKEERA